MSKIHINSSVVIDHGADWPEFKKWLDGTYAKLRYAWSEDDYAYVLVAEDGNIVRTVGINKDAQTNQEDFEASWKKFEALQSTTQDGRLEVRQTVAKRMSNFNLRVFSFYTAKSGSLHNVNPITGQDFGDVEYEMYDASGSLVTDPMLSGTVVKTVVDFMPKYNYEIVGGFADFPDSLKGGKTDEWYIGGVGLPDVAAQYYGQIPYISEVNIEAVNTQRVNSDGRAVSYMPYKLYGMNTNELRFYIKHPPGAQERFQIYLEHYN